MTLPLDLVNKYIIAIPFVEEKKGLLIVPTDKASKNIFTVISAHTELTVKTGDKILANIAWPKTFEYEDKVYCILEESEVIGILHEK